VHHFPTIDDVHSTRQYQLYIFKVHQSHLRSHEWNHFMCGAIAESFRSNEEARYFDKARNDSLERKSLPWYLKDMQSMPLLLPTSYLRDNYQGFKEATGKGMSGL
jgi:hypothetical protein